MTLLVDTSVWSVALRRDQVDVAPETVALRRALEGGDSIVTTGLILQELLQGFSGPRARKDILERFSALPLLVPARQDYIDAAELLNSCRRAGLQLGTIDALLAQLCIRHHIVRDKCGRGCRRDRQGVISGFLPAGHQRSAPMSASARSSRAEVSAAYSAARRHGRSPPRAGRNRRPSGRRR